MRVAWPSAGQSIDTSQTRNFSSGAQKLRSYIVWPRAYAVTLTWAFCLSLQCYWLPAAVFGSKSYVNQYGNVIEGLWGHPSWLAEVYIYLSIFLAIYLIFCIFSCIFAGHVAPNYTCSFVGLNRVCLNNKLGDLSYTHNVMQSDSGNIVLLKTAENHNKCKLHFLHLYLCTLASR